MEAVPTHHRALALLLAVAAVAALGRAAPPPVVPPPAVEQAAPPSRINPHTADARALDSLPGVGPALARRIIAARAAGLVIQRPEDLLRVRGIGPATLARMRDRLSFETATSRSATPRPRSP